MAQSAPRISWSGFKGVLAQVMSGLVRVDMDYCPENDSSSEQSSEAVPVRVATDESWQNMLEHLRAKSQQAATEDPIEVEVDLLLFKTGDAGNRLGAKR